MTVYRSRLPLTGLLLVLSIAVGCGQRSQGPTRASVSGNVTLDGKPLKQGTILFTPTEGVRGMTAGGPIENGRYHLDADKGPTLGMNRVMVQASKPSTQKIPNPAVKGEWIFTTIEAVDERYNSETTLKIEIKPGDNSADFNVFSQ
jgi:hypothetical protein